jgi:integrase/recombinase XerD
LKHYVKSIMNDQKRGIRLPPWRISREMFLSETEVERLLGLLRFASKSDSAATGDPARHAALAARDRLLIEALLFSGLRNSEVCGLRVADTIIGTGQSVFLVRGTPRQDRTVHVPRSVSLFAQDFVRVHRLNLVRSVSELPAGERPLLLNDRGKAFDRTSLYRRVVSVLTAAGLGDRASAQLLRHTYGYLAYKRSGGNLLFIQSQMGHAHPMVSSVYAEFCEEDYSEIADRVGQAPVHSLTEISRPQRSVRKEKSHARPRGNSQSRKSRRR